MPGTAGRHLPGGAQPPSPRNHPLKPPPPRSSALHPLRTRPEQRAHSRPSLLLTNHDDTLSPPRGPCAAGGEPREPPQGAATSEFTEAPSGPVQPGSRRREGEQPYKSGMSPANPSTGLGNQPNRLLSPRPGQAGGEAPARVAEANSSRGGGGGAAAWPRPTQPSIAPSRHSPPPRSGPLSPPHRAAPRPRTAARAVPASPRFLTALTAPARAQRGARRGAQTGSGGPEAGGGRRLPPPSDTAARPFAGPKRRPHRCRLRLRAAAFHGRRQRRAQLLPPPPHSSSSSSAAAAPPRLAGGGAGGQRLRPAGPA